MWVASQAGPPFLFDLPTFPGPSEEALLEVLCLAESGVLRITASTEAGAHSAVVGLTPLSFDPSVPSLDEREASGSPAVVARQRRVVPDDVLRLGDAQ